MKVTKFIVFADSTTNCSGAGNFISSDLRLSFFSAGVEHAIGLCASEGAKMIQSYDKMFDVFLFNDTGLTPDSDGIFFSKFGNSFYANREQWDFRVILHKGSSWTFSDIDATDGSFYSPFNREIEWFSSFEAAGDLIYQSHIEDSVYCRDLKQIAAAISSRDQQSYNAGLQLLSNRFIDRQLEELLRPFVAADPFKKDPKLADAIQKLGARADELIANRRK